MIQNEKQHKTHTTITLSTTFLNINGKITSPYEKATVQCFTQRLPAYLQTFNFQKKMYELFKLYQLYIDIIIDMTI